MRKRTMCLFIILLMLILGQAYAQKTIIFAAVLSNKNYVVGAENAPAGVVVSADSGRSWARLCWPNCRAFDVAVGEGGRVCYVAGGNGVLKTLNGGITWRVTTGWEITEVQDVQVHPDDTSWVSTGTAYGVYVSEDGGNTWEKRNKGLKSTFCSALQVDNFSDQRLWVGTEDGLYYSENRGVQWHTTNLTETAVRVIIQHPVKVHNLLAGTEDRGVFISKDNGRSWIPSNRGINELTVYALCYDPADRRRIYAGTHGKGVYRSTDGGGTWKRSSRGLTNVVHSLTALPDGSALYAGTVNHGVFISRDRGENWQHTGLEGAQVWELETLNTEGNINEKQ